METVFIVLAVLVLILLGIGFFISRSRRHKESKWVAPATVTDYKPAMQKLNNPRYDYGRTARKQVDSYHKPAQSVDITKPQKRKVDSDGYSYGSGAAIYDTGYVSDPAWYSESTTVFEGYHDYSGSVTSNNDSPNTNCDPSPASSYDSSSGSSDYSSGSSSDYGSSSCGDSGYSSGSDSSYSSGSSDY